MARTIESRFLEVILTLVWQTALQNMDFMSIAGEIGQETASMLTARKEDFRNSKIRFRVRGISGLIDRQTELNNLLAMLQTISQNELLMQKFMERVDMGKLLERMFKLFGVNESAFKISPLESQINALTGVGQPAAPNGQQATPGVTP